MISVRHYRPSDSRRARELVRELSRAHRDLFRLTTPRGRPPEAWFRALRRNGLRNLWMAEEAGRVVGFVALAAHRDSGEVEALVVAASHRRRGIARLLLTRVKEEAARRGWTALSAQAVVRNAAALRTFHALGFRTAVNVDLLAELDGRGWFRPRPGPRIAGRPFRS